MHVNLYFFVSPLIVAFDENHEVITKNSLSFFTNFPRRKFYAMFS
jgi:hypothetical protein